VIYQDASFSISLGGVLIWDPTNTTWTGFDFVDNWLNFNHIKFRLSFIDADSGAIKSFQGSVMISGHDLAFNAINNVKSSLTLPGSGKLLYFDGYIPCPATIASVTVTGQTAGDGIIHIAYTYTGTPTQMKYRIDGMGSYIITAIGAPIDIPGLSVGTHTYELILTCLNGYDIDSSTTGSFTLTQGLTCSAVITDIALTALSAAPVYTGTPSFYIWSIDGGAPTTYPISSQVSLAGQSVGSHTINMIPVCANGVQGTGFTKPFTVASQPAQSIINYQFLSFVAGNVLQIYVNTGSGFVIQVTPAIGSSGAFNVPTGAQVKGVLSGNNNTGSHAQLETQDLTLSSILDNQTGTIPVVLQYTFTTNGDTYQIGATVTP
jgi:hypothetical protein